MEPLTVYNEEVTGPEHAILIANRACRAALSDRGVAHLAIGKDVQSMKLSADQRSAIPLLVRLRSPPLSAPPPDQLRAAATILTAGSRVAVLAGRGALSAREEITELADVLCAPVPKALAVLPDDSPFMTGGIGDLGTAPSSWAMQSCDKVLSSVPRCHGRNTIRNRAKRAGYSSTSSPPSRSALSGRNWPDRGRQGDVAGYAA